MIMSTTRSYCCDCGTTHPASFEERSNRVYFKVACPREMREVLVSRDAALFSAIREKSCCDLTGEKENINYSWENFVEITNDCNFDCPTCFVTCENDRKYYLSMEEYTARLSTLKKKKRASITISGGEPTLHPALFKMIRAARKKGIAPKILTNGTMLGRDEHYAIRLKKSGIEYCFIQFDSLKEATNRFIRGIDRVNEKIKALAGAVKANLYLGVNCLVFDKNLSELGELLPFFFSHAPHLGIINLICPAKASGRFEIDEKSMVDRETVINTVVKTGVIKGLTSDHFLPLPRFSALGIDLHPDCVAFTVAAVIKGEITPLDDFIDFEKLYSLLDRAKMKTRPILGSFLFMYLISRSIRPGSFFACLKMLLGFILKKGKNSFVIITVEQFMNEIYQDVQRLKHCTTSIVLENGALVPGCIYNHPDERRGKNTRLAGRKAKKP